MEKESWLNMIATKLDVFKIPIFLVFDKKKAISSLFTKILSAIYFIFIAYVAIYSINDRFGQN